MSANRLPMPVRKITGTVKPVVGCYSGMATGVKLNGVPVLVIAASTQDLVAALPECNLDRELCVEMSVAVALNFTYTEPDL